MPATILAALLYGQILFGALAVGAVWMRSGADETRPAIQTTQVEPTGLVR